MNLPELTAVLDEIEFFGVSFEKVARVLGWIGVERSDVAVWNWSEEFTLLAAVDPDTRHLLHAAVAPSRNSLTTRRFLAELGELYGRVPPIVVTDRATYGPVFTRLGVTRIIRRHSVRNRVERWLQELKRRVDTFYARSPATTSKPQTTGFANSPGRGMSP